MLVTSQAQNVQVNQQILHEIEKAYPVKNVYNIAIFDNRVQWNTGKPRFRHARVVTTSNCKRFREYVRLATKGRFNFCVYENKLINGKIISTKITTYQPDYDEEIEHKVKIAS